MPVRGKLMPISLVQQGTLSEFLFIILTVLGSNGMLEASRPATDDDRRDCLFIHI